MLPESGDTDLFERFAVVGADVGDFMERVTKRFAINADSYRWYFHHRNEGTNFGALLFKPIHKRVAHKPITADHLVEAIATNQWPILYPPTHEVPPARSEIRVNQLLFSASVVVLALWLWRHLVA